MRQRVRDGGSGRSGMRETAILLGLAGALTAGCAGLVYAGPLPTLWTLMAEPAFSAGAFVEYCAYVSREGAPWPAEKYVYRGRVLQAREGEPQYQVRSYDSKAGGSRDTWVYSYQVRAPRKAVYDEYDPRLLHGSWSVVQGVTRTSTETSTHRITETNLSSYGGSLVIRPDGTYTWQVTPKSRFTGQWSRSTEPGYPIMLKKGNRGSDWYAGPEGIGPDGRAMLSLRDSRWLLSYTGFRAKGGPAARLSPVYTPGQKTASATPTTPAAGPGVPAKQEPAAGAPQPTAGPRWSAGDAVEVFNGLWQEGTVKEVRGQRYVVTSNLFPERVVPGYRIRPRGSGPFTDLKAGDKVELLTPEPGTDAYLLTSGVVVEPGTNVIKVRLESKGKTAGEVRQIQAGPDYRRECPIVRVLQR